MSQLLTDKDVVGRETWGVLHRYAAKYPEKPAKKDKDEFHTFFKAILRQIPDGDCKCRTHAVEYVMKHRPDTSSRYGLSMYLCDFHNEINRTLGKEQKNCTTMMRDYGIECTTCGIRQSRNIPFNTNIFAEFKKISIKVFEEFCKREGIPVPHIIFSPCPTDKSTSCVNMKWNEQTDEVAKDVRSKVYINPSSFGLRTLIHELVEYKRQMKSEKRLAEDEDAVEKEVQDIIAKEFPHDTEKEILKPSAIYKDGIAIPIPPVQPQPQPYQPFQYLKTFRANLPEQFPSYAKIRKRYSSTLAEDENNREGYDIQSAIDTETVHQEKEQVGVLSYFDGIYEPFAKFTGVRARDLNRSNTPTIFSNGVMAIARSNLTEFGSLLFSTVFGMAMFMATIFTNRDTIGFEDKRLLTQLGGNFVWNGVQYYNPKIAPELMAQAQLFVASILNQRFDKLPGSLIQTPSDYKTLTLSAEQEAVQQAASQRSAERSTGRSPSGGGGSAARSTQRGLTNTEAQNIVQRAMQRSEGIQSPEDPSTFRNFGAGNVYIRPGPNPGFTYVPTISGGSGIDDYLLDAENGGGTVGVNPNISTRALEGISQDELSELGIM